MAGCGNRSSGSYLITISTFVFYLKMVSCLMKMFEARQEEKWRHFLNVFSRLLLIICF